MPIAFICIWCKTRKHAAEAATPVGICILMFFTACLFVSNIVQEKCDRFTLSAYDPTEAGFDAGEVFVFEVDAVLLPLFGQFRIFEFAGG